jgi:DNA processing protein
MTPHRMRVLLARYSPDAALDALCGGRPLDPGFVRDVPTEVLAPMRASARAADPAAAAAACARAGVRIVGRTDPAYPSVLGIDPFAPSVVFVRGDLGAVDRRRVGVVGTRNATSAGRATAAELGAALSDAGVSVVSGLAAGIDAAAHAGVRDASSVTPPIGVVGCGLDRPYPSRQHALWNWVADVGLLLSEWPPGVPPHAWRFPQRNRIIAALSEVLVVVESRDRGGSLITAQMALDRNVEVMAVPGSTRSPASAGTNRLLRDGAAPVTAVDDVLTMLGLDHRRQGELPFDPRPLPTGDRAAVLRACEVQPSTLDMLATAAHLDLIDAALAVARLERDGWVVEVGGWFEATSSHLDRRASKRAAS